MEEKTIIIADDQQFFAEGIFNMLNNTGYKVVGYAADGFALLNLLDGFVPDVVLLDINIPRINGFESARKIKALYPGIKIIMLTLYTGPYLFNLAIKNDFDGYLMKNAKSDELIEAIDKVLKNETVIPQIDINNFKNDHFDPSLTIAAINSLAMRERIILKLIAKQMTMEEIAAKLYLSRQAAETCRKNLLMKLNGQSTFDLAVLALNNGIN